MRSRSNESNNLTIKYVEQFSCASNGNCWLWTKEQKNKHRTIARPANKRIIKLTSVKINVRQSKRENHERAAKKKRHDKWKGDAEKNTMQEDKSQAYVFGCLLLFSSWCFFLADQNFSTPFRETVSKIDARNTKNKRSENNRRSSDRDYCVSICRLIRPSAYIAIN